MIQGQSAWEYAHTEHAWPVCHAFMQGHKMLNGNPMLKQKLSLIQQTECNNHLRGGIVNLVNLSETTWLTAMQKMGYRYAVVWFDGCWPATDDFNMKLLDEIDRFSSDRDTKWMVAGQIVNNNDYYPYFAKSFMVINIDVWHECRKPNPFVKPVYYPNYFNLDPSKNFEDSMYAIEIIRKDQAHADKQWWTKSAEDKLVDLDRVGRDFGDAWIPWALREKYTVWGLSDDLMDTVTMTKPWMNTDAFEKAIMGEPVEEELSYQGAKLVERTFNPTSPVYFVNTEPSQPEVATQLIDTEFDQYVGASAGFKLLYYAYKYGVNPGFSKFVWYDFDKDSCQFKRDTLKHWNGDNYVRWVDEWCDANPQANQSLRPLVRERWPGVVDQFGGPDSWGDFWAQVTSTDYEVIQCDLINGHDELFERLKNQRTFMWTSNIYSYIVPRLLDKNFMLESSFMSLVQKLNTLHDDCWFSGTDVNDNDIMCPSKAILSVANNNGIGYE